MHRVWLVLVVACSSKSEAPPPPAPAPHGADAAVARDAAVAIDAAPSGPIRALTTLPLVPTYRVELVGASHKRAVVFSVDGDGEIVTTRLDTGTTVESWKPTELAELGHSAWRSGNATKSGKPELEVDLAARLDGIRREAELVRAVMLEAGVQTLAGLAISPDGATTIVKGGDLLYWLRDAQPPALLDVGASYDAAVAADGKHVAYNGCTSPCGTYTLRIVELGATMRPRITKVVDPKDIFWDGDAVIAKSGTCIVRVDAATLAQHTVACDRAIEGTAVTPARDVALLARTKAGRELRIYRTDGKLARSVALPSKLPAARIAVIAVAGDGKALVSLLGPRDSSETFLVGTDGAVKPLTLPGKGKFAGSAIWIDSDRALALVQETVFALDVPALLR